MALILEAKKTATAENIINTMSDTPLTAKAKIACGFQAVPQFFLEHAEKLERENAALLADNKRLEEDRRYLFYRPEYVSIEKLERENAALREALQKLAALQFGVHGVCESHLTLYGPTVRDIACAAIDAARKEAQP